MRHTARSAVLAAALLLAFAPAAAAQMPGGDLTDPRDTRQAFLAEVLGNVENTVQQWRAARETRDARALARLYTRDAVLIPLRGEPSRGAGEVRRALSELLPRESEFRATFSDFTASGGLAYYSGEFTYIVTPAEGVPYTASGTYVLVLERRDGGWRIRSHIEHPDVDVLMAQLAPPASAAPPASSASLGDETPAPPAEAAAPQAPGESAAGGSRR